MSRIRELQNKVIASKSVYPRLNSISRWFARIANRGKSLYYKGYITLHVNALQEERIVKEVARVMANNALSAALERNDAGTKFLIDTAVLTGIRIARPLRNIVGVQPIESPVGLVYTMQYKEQKKEEPESEPRDESPAIDTTNGLIQGSQGKKFTLEVVANPVEARPRKLTARINMEVKREMEADGKDMSGELIDALSSQISQDTVDSMLHYLVNKCDSVTECVLSNEDSFEKRLDKLPFAVMAAASEIARRTRRGAGNFLICSPQYISLLQASRLKFTPATEDDIVGDYFTLRYAGTIQGGIKVFGNLSMKDTILIGYKGGNGEIDAGVIFSPHSLIPLGSQVDPESYTPFEGFAMKAGVLNTSEVTQPDIIGKGGYYAVINVKSDGLFGEETLTNN